MDTKPDFIIGVFSQPISSFAKWKQRGINTLVSHEPEGGRIKKSDWEAAAAAAGFFFMSYPDPSLHPAILRAEAAQSCRLAWMQDDEPDLTRDLADPRNHPTGPYKGWRDPAPFEKVYATCKSLAPDMPVFCNFAGPQITPIAYTHGQGHARYLAAADWLAHDWYVKNKNADRYPIDLIAQAMDRLAKWTAPAHKAQFVFIECSPQNISPLGRCPTAEEVEQEVELAIRKGAKGIIYFPQRLHGFSFDAIPPEIVTRITQINHRLTASNEPTSSTPAPNEPILQSILTQLTTLTTKLDTLSAQVTALQNQKFRATLDLTNIPDI